MTQWISPKTLPNSLASVPIIDVRGTYPVNSKYSWEFLNGKRPVASLTTIVVHHDALSKASTAMYSDEELIRRIATSHINSTRNLKGGDNFPYHLFIRNGKVYICNEVTDKTFGVASNNDYTIHICVSGNYAASDVLLDADRYALYTAIQLAKSSMTAFKDIKAHKEITATACPGFEINKVRSDTNEIELSMHLSENLNEQLANVSAMFRRVDGLYKTASTQGKYQEEAIRKMNKIANMMRSEGLL